MGEIVATNNFDPFELDLPIPSEIDSLAAMQAEGRAYLYEADGSWLIIEDLGNSSIGIPFARGKMDGMKRLFTAVIDDCDLNNVTLCWVRGRPGWERAIKDMQINVEIHSVCYKITKRELH